MSWKLHNEPWMQKLNVFDEFKIRASWGISGNQGISPYQTLNRYRNREILVRGQMADGHRPGL